MMLVVITSSSSLDIPVPSLLPEIIEYIAS
jgi:hypothetical protein